jgi:hypothetical protein
MTRLSKRPPLTGRVTGVYVTRAESQPRIDGVLDDGRRVWLNFAPETNDPGVIARQGGHEAVVAERMRSLAQTLLAAADRLETGRQ